MRVPLLVNANPRIIREGPIVTLKAGDWDIERDVKDSWVGISLNGSVPCDKVKVTGPCTVQVIINEPGKELISVWANQCH